MTISPKDVRGHTVHFTKDLNGVPKGSPNSLKTISDVRGCTLSISWIPRRIVGALLRTCGDPRENPKPVGDVAWAGMLALGALGQAAGSPESLSRASAKKCESRWELQHLVVWCFLFVGVAITQQLKSRDKVFLKQTLHLCLFVIVFSCPDFTEVSLLRF